MSKRGHVVLRRGYGTDRTALGCGGAALAPGQRVAQHGHLGAQALHLGLELARGARRAAAHDWRRLRRRGLRAPAVSVCAGLARASVPGWACSSAARDTGGSCGASPRLGSCCAVMAMSLACCRNIATTPASLSRPTAIDLGLAESRCKSSRVSCHTCIPACTGVDMTSSVAALYSSSRCVPTAENSSSSSGFFSAAIAWRACALMNRRTKAIVKSLLASGVLCGESAGWGHPKVSGGEGTATRGARGACRT
eukprot:scaffold16214_cov109-Isochrysis_galbana.AAC.3